MAAPSTADLGGPLGDPDGLLAEAVAGVGADLEEADCWESWLGTSPLVTRMAERARLTEFERAMMALLPHLQTVCQRPRLMLRTEDERTAVGRARRIPARAVEVLASRPEDWDRRTYTTVHPLRVLATHIEDLWDTYENRVAARLVDHLLREVGRRVFELRGIQSMAADGEDQGENVRGARTCEFRLILNTGIGPS